jgi:hypothetical protein
VQQPHQNRTERSRNAYPFNLRKSAYLSHARGRTRKAISAFARRRSGVRIPSAPLRKYAYCSAEIAAECLGVPHLGHSGARAYRKSPTGGEHETVEMFVLEAYEANIVLKLYEAATAPTVDLSAIARFMSSSRYHATHLPEVYRRTVKTEREFWSQDVGLAQHWALRVAEETVARKVENEVYPVFIGEPGSYPDAGGSSGYSGRCGFR